MFLIWIYFYLFFWSEWFRLFLWGTINHLSNFYSALVLNVIYFSWRFFLFIAWFQTQRLKSLIQIRGKKSNQNTFWQMYMVNGTFARTCCGNLCLNALWSIIKIATHEFRFLFGFCHSLSRIRIYFNFKPKFLIL